MNSLPDDVEPMQKRMSFSATDMPALETLNKVVASNNKAALDKLRNFGSKVSSIVTRQAAPTINKLTTQGFLFIYFYLKRKLIFFSAKQLPINETVTSLFKVIGDGSSSLVRSSATKSTGDDGRGSPTHENSRKRILQNKFDEREKDLCSTQCRTTCLLLPIPDLNLIYMPNNNDQNK
jgi:hypothetical protein